VAPEEILRALVKIEIAARDASNQATRTRDRRLPVLKILDEFGLATSGIPTPTFASCPHSNGSTPARTLP